MAYQEEFYVKRVLEAKIINVGTRNNPKKGWTFLTEWADYPDPNWEPEENFIGTKWALQTFWRRAELRGRDPKRLRLFKMGEIISLPNEAPKEKPGPGRSSVGLILGTRVFALWPETCYYQSAVVQRRIEDEYEVRFDEDDVKFIVALEHMRPCAEIQEGDTVILKADSARISAVKEDGTLRIKKRIGIDDIRISAWSIEDEWGDRKLAHEDIDCADDV
ncbi:hypothetical protein B0H17DRAFT_1333352 [Mycena rosella]|uniref:Chromo domain-containing protein n=1 Tax=Mycena rosella TaxID=1033263 RepID=A0AAD7D7G9_MYCRO|nr:hypothetical protein B0H17DRAFT_1333352 [Mycena rosella]